MRGLTEWLRAAARPLPVEAFTSSFVPLPALIDAVGDARLVLLAEAHHFDAREHAFRNCLFRNLVEAKHFSAIAIESGLIEGRPVHKFVRGEEGDVEQVVSQGLNWGFGEIEENIDLVRWLRAHNESSPGADMVNFYGSGISGMPSTHQSAWRYTAALAELLDFLRVVDPLQSAALRSALSALEPISFHTQRIVEGLNYADLPASHRAAISAVIGDVGAWLDDKAADYVARSSNDAFAWAQLAADHLRQLDDWLQQVPVGWRPSSDPASDYPPFFGTSSEIGDQALADNLRWILEREGSAARILAYASRYHLNTAPWHDARWGCTGRWHRRHSAGSYLRRQMGDAVVSIGHLIAEAAAKGSVDALVAGASESPFFVDLRQAPEDLKRQLASPRIFGGDDHGLRLPFDAAFDLLVVVPSKGRGTRSAGWHSLRAAVGGTQIFRRAGA